MTRNKSQDEVYDKECTSSIAVAELPDSDLDSVNGGNWVDSYGNTWAGGSNTDDAGEPWLPLPVSVWW